MSGESQQNKKASGLGLITLVVGALGIVYGDIGTSPLYAVNEIFFGHSHISVTAPHVLGAISLVIWVLTLVVTLKYVAFVLLANREGEGGVFALLGLLSEFAKSAGMAVLVGILVLAAGLLFGDGLITPAISILSAVEGLSVATSVFNPYIIPITLVILTILFGFQYKGTGKVGAIFGPVMLVWFIVLAALGVNQIIQTPDILAALNPYYALSLLGTIGWGGIFLLFGAVVLAVTGGEALYADLGYFGLTPIRMSWLYFVYPALILNYLGQGAYLLSGAPVANANLFYSLVPKVVIYPMVVLAALATVIASQALISGAFSLAAQAVALNFSPRFKINHTSITNSGQIYVPAINWALYIGSASLVIIFGSSASLAAAYGLAESGVMFSTSLAMMTIAARYWKWGWTRSLLLFGFFACIDFAFLVSNSLKFFQGGYVPVIIGLSLYVVMSNWNWGRNMVFKAYDNYNERRKMSAIVALKQKLEEGSGVVVDERGQFVESGRAVIFMVATPIKTLEDNVPALLRSFMRNYGAIPKYTILLTVTETKHSRMHGNRYEINNFGYNVYGVVAKFGFTEDIQIEPIIKDLSEKIPVLKHGKYMIEAGSEELRIDHVHSSLVTKMRIRFFRRLQRISTPTYRYFGFEPTTILSTDSIPIMVNDKGGMITMPDLDLT